MKPMIIFASKWGAIGLIIPLFWLLLWSLAEKPLAQNARSLWLGLHIVENITWPFSILPVGDILPASSRYFVLAQMILGNFVLYAVIGAIYWLIFKRSASI